MIATPPVSRRLTMAMDFAAQARLGIVRVAAEHFHVGPYRYARLSDAIAEAQRGRIPDNDA